MADDVQTTSYSDPIYDRLEALANRMRRWRNAILGAIVLAVFIGLGLRAWLNHRPEADSAVAFVQAENEPDDVKRTAALEALVDGPGTTPLYQARAALELVQESLSDGSQDLAVKWLAKAVSAAATANSDQLSIIVRLAQGAVAEDAGKAEESIGHYESVERAAGARFPIHYLTAVIGAARVQLAKGDAKGAIERLGTVVDRTDDAVRDLIPVAKVLYWQAKRAVDGVPTDIADPKAPPKVEVTPAPAAPAEGAPAPVSAAPAGE